MAEPILVAEGITKQFKVSRGLFRPPLSVSAVDGVDLALRPGETFSIVGESGCGKSTLLRLLLRLIEPSAGRLAFAGEDLLRLSSRELRARRRRMQMIFQDPFASLDPRMSVGAILEEPLALHQPGDAVERRARVAELLSLVGLAPSHATRYAHEFSGGQRQRIGIARALALNPSLIMADEPVSALDVSIQAQIINLLEDLQDKFGLTYLMVAHDLTVVKHISDRVAVMYLGRIVETAPTRQLYAAPRHPYTQSLLAAIPVPRPGLQRSTPLLEGDPPNPASPPSGCRFHTRCRFARPRCSGETPTLELIDAEHQVACHFWRDVPIPADLGPMKAAASSPAYLRRLAAIERKARENALQR